MVPVFDNPGDFEVLQYLDIVRVSGLVKGKGKYLNKQYGFVLNKNGPEDCINDYRYEILMQLYDDETELFYFPETKYMLKPENLSKWRRPETYDAAEEDVQFNFSDPTIANLIAVRNAIMNNAYADSTPIAEIEKPMEWFDKKSETEQKNLLAGIIESVKKHHSCSSRKLETDMKMVYGLSKKHANELCFYVLKNEMVPKTRFQIMFIAVYDALRRVDEFIRADY